MEEISLNLVVGNGTCKYPVALGDGIYAFSDPSLIIQGRLEEVATRTAINPIEELLWTTFRDPKYFARVILFVHQQQEKVVRSYKSKRQKNFV